MKILDLTFSSAADDLACDEALLDGAEASGGPEVLRFWEPKKYFVVLGYSNAWKTEVLSPEKRAVPVYRRCSGGGTVLQGPGCLNYSLVLKIDGDGASRDIRATNEYVMHRHRAALAKLTGKKVAVQGHTDLTLGELKFSGNSQRRKRKYLLFHGTFLLDFDLARIDRWLAIPEKQPTYRQNRPHSSFVINLGIPAGRIKRSLETAWGAKSALKTVPRDGIRKLSGEKYSRDEWNLKF